MLEIITVGVKTLYYIRDTTHISEGMLMAALQGAVAPLVALSLDLPQQYLAIGAASAIIDAFDGDAGLEFRERPPGTSLQSAFLRLVVFVRRLLGREN